MYEENFHFIRKKDWVRYGRKSVRPYHNFSMRQRWHNTKQITARTPPLPPPPKGDTWEKDKGMIYHFYNNLSTKSFFQPFSLCASGSDLHKSRTIINWKSYSLGTIYIYIYSTSTGAICIKRPKQTKNNSTTTTSTSVKCSQSYSKR